MSLAVESSQSDEQLLLCRISAVLWIYINVLLNNEQ